MRPFLTFSVDCNILPTDFYVKEGVRVDCLSSSQLHYSTNSVQQKLNDQHTPQHRLSSTQATHLIYNIPSGSLTVSVFIQLM